MTLVFRAPGVLSAPLPGAPVIPNLEYGVLWTLDAQDLALPNGASISSWVASGPAPAVDRTFNSKYAGWNFPTYSLAGGPGGKPAALFNGTQQIANDVGVTLESQPLSLVFVCKSDTFASTQSRILTAGNQIIGPGATGYYASNAGESRLESGVSAAGWLFWPWCLTAPTPRSRRGRALLSKALLALPRTTETPLVVKSPPLAESA
ncbi:hypothetical protein [Pseudomonas sp. TH10]|uniref:hypothetical protein n=1 Tax=Pseudomonas sp. TH10 TaxID=2796376 RepID=UPI0019134594|nr:hypothetical protein [Pseudomonas sp. TH10]MBK5517964.1 hypothetical protein [Pseudomonas sp. TH10]